MKKTLTALILLYASPAFAATWHVQSTASEPQLGTIPSPFGTLSQAIAAAGNGDTILVGGGVYGSESVLVNKRVDIQGTGPGLARFIDTDLRITAPYTAVQGLWLNTYFGGKSIGIRAEAPFTIQDCQIDGYNYGIYVDEVGGSAMIRRNRLLGNRWGVYLYRSGLGSYVQVENNVLANDGTVYTGGIIGYRSRFRAYQNLLTGYYWGIVSSLYSSDNLQISYFVRNLIVNGTHGIYAINADPYEIRAYANAFDVAVPTQGVNPGDVLWSVNSACGAPTDLGLPYDHDFEPSGPCIDGGIYGLDLDGTMSDIGPYGGPQGGPWWDDFSCEGPVNCP